jgi:hypothetical protein
MKRAKKIGYIIGGIVGAAVLIADVVISYILAHPDNSYYCQTMSRVFGTHDCALRTVQANHAMVILIAAALVVLGGFLGEVIGKLSSKKAV